MTDDEMKVQRLNAMVDELERLATANRMAFVRLRRELPILLLIVAMVGMIVGIAITRLVHG